MFTVKTYDDACRAMQTRAVVALHTKRVTNPTRVQPKPEDDRVFGVINSISAEDGSGNCWNIVVQQIDSQGGDPITVFLRDPD